MTVVTKRPGEHSPWRRYPKSLHPLPKKPEPISPALGYLRSGNLEKLVAENILTLPEIEVQKKYLQFFSLGEYANLKQLTQITHLPPSPNTTDQMYLICFQRGDLNLAARVNELYHQMPSDDILKRGAEIYHKRGRTLEFTYWAKTVSP